LTQKHPHLPIKIAAHVIIRGAVLKNLKRESSEELEAYRKAQKRVAFWKSSSAVSGGRIPPVLVTKTDARKKNLRGRERHIGISLFFISFVCLEKKEDS
jgi:hypothetical protein